MCELFSWCLLTLGDCITQKRELAPTYSIPVSDNRELFSLPCFRCSTLSDGPRSLKEGKGDHLGRRCLWPCTICCCCGRLSLLSTIYYIIGKEVYHSSGCRLIVRCNVYPVWDLQCVLSGVTTKGHIAAPSNLCSMKWWTWGTIWIMCWRNFKGKTSMVQASKRRETTLTD